MLGAVVLCLLSPLQIRQNTRPWQARMITKQAEISSSEQQNVTVSVQALGASLATFFRLGNRIVLANMPPSVLESPLLIFGACEF